MAITVNGGQPTANVTLSAELAAAITDESGTGALVFNTSPTLVTPALGTPSSATLTNATGLPVSGITASTSTALGVGSVELGHATDTTLARSSAGVISVEGVVVPTISSTSTLTNKTLTTPIISSISNTGTLTLPTSTDTLVGRATTDTLTNKTLTSPTIGSGATHTGSTSGSTVLQASATASGTLTLPAATDTLVGKATTDTFTNKTLTSPVINTATYTGGSFSDAIVKGLNEDVNVVAAAATGTINIEVGTASIWYYTTNATANHTLNFRYSSTVSLNTFMATGDSLTVVWLNTNGSTAYYPSAFQIDGNSVTPKVPAAITAGNASSIDAYSFTIIKTASATFTVLETQTKFA